MKKLIVTTSFLAIALLMNVAPAYAVTGDFTIYPSYMHRGSKSWILLDLKQGEAVTDYVTVENLTNEPQTLTLEVREATEETGSYLLVESNEYASIGNWIRLTEQSVALKPYEKKRVPVEIKVPQNADIKNYKASVLGSKTETNSQNINITTRIGVRMYVDVHEATPSQANIFASPLYASTAFFVFSLLALLAAVFYNVIHYLENKKYAKNQA